MRNFSKPSSQEQPPELDTCPEFVAPIQLHEALVAAFSIQSTPNKRLFNHVVSVPNWSIIRVYGLEISQELCLLITGGIAP